MRKLTGMTVVLDNQPPLDVDTALLQLREELMAGNRKGAAVALDAALRDIEHRREQMDIERPLFALTPDKRQWKVVAANWETGVLTLEPYAS
jgi:hypothetical protein